MEGNEEKNIDINFISKGLFTDSSKEDQPKGTYSFALNAVDETTEGDIFSISNENSNFLCTDIPENYKLIGSVYLNNDDNLLFFIDISNNNSIISLLGKDCTLTDLVISDCLQFKLNYQIEGTFRIKNGCNRIIYFSDHFNPDRYIDIDNLSDFLKTGYNLSDTSVSKWNCNSFSIDKITTDPCITLLGLNELGKNIPVGVIQFSVQLLDSNFNGTGFSDPTATIPITNDSYNNDYINIDGSIAGLPTNKAVNISISNIDTNFSYVQIAAIITTDGIEQSYIVDEIPISGDTINYTFKGLDNYDSPVVLNFTKNILSSKTITQLENRLIRANVKSPNKDYSYLQRNYANNISSIYVVKREHATHIATGAKSDNYYYNTRSYMRDEIYAFGIYYIYSDGTKSPVFHIPGRSKNPNNLNGLGDWNNLESTGTGYISGQTGKQHSRAFANGNWDTTIYTIVTDGTQNYETTISESEVNHLGLYSGDTIERWKVYNTAVKHRHKEVSFTYSTGEMSYHECDDVYPEIQDCNGEYIYGDLKGTPIRHHKFPDSTLEPFYDGTYIYPIGIHFKNIILPPDVVDYKIVRCERDFINKTVLDKGIGYYTRNVESKALGNINFQAPFFNKHLSVVGVTPDNSFIMPDGPEAGFEDNACNTIFKPLEQANKLCYHSGVTKITTPYLGASYIKSELAFFGDLETLGYDDYNTALKCKYENIKQITRSSKTNITINNQVYIEGNSIERNNLSQKFVNNFQNEVYALDLKSSAKVVSSDMTDLLILAGMSASPYDPGSGNYVKDGVGYYSLKSSNVNVYTNLHSLVYYPVTNCIDSSNSKTVFGGDIFLCQLSYKQMLRGHSCILSDNANANGVTWGDGTEYKHSYNHIVTFYGESEINTEMRHELFEQYYYPKSYNNVSDLYNNFLLPSTKDENFIPNYYNYNTDFSKYNKSISYIPLPITWKYCSNCLNEFPNRVYYSEQSFQEELSDNYLLTLVNNYRDIISNKGNITKIYSYRSNLLIDCTMSRFVLPSTSQAIQASEENITIGTGEFFSLPVKEIISSDTGYLGNTSQWANVVTENGIFSIDADSGNVFIYNDSLNTLSNSKFGMYNYFKENLPLNINKEYNNLRGTNINKDNPANIYSDYGHIAIYDSRHNRFILTKKDYKLTNEGINLVLASTGINRLDLTDEGWKYLTFGGSSLIKPSEHPEWFENISWTLSFSLNRNAWISWHSYLPTNFIKSKLSFYSSNNLLDSNIIYKHDKKFEYQTFYDIYYPHILEVVNSTNHLNTDIYNSIEFITKAKQWDNTNKYFIDKRLITFDKAIIYNNYQNSGLINLLTKREQTSFNRDVESWHQQALLDVNERTYSFNEFRDLIGDYNVPMFTKNWSNNEYKTNYYIDKVINPSAINLNKNWWEQDIFRGKHLTLRLFFSILANIKLTTQFNLFEKKTTFR